MKICQKCFNEYPETREFFGQYKNERNGNIKIGFRNTCRKCIAENTARYDKKNPESALRRSSNRQLREALTVGVTPKDLPSLRMHLGDTCRYCSAPLNGMGEIDHLTPIARGGTNNTNNLTLACSSCNKAKTSKTFDEYLNWRLERKLLIRQIKIISEKPDPVLRNNLRENINKIKF